nr:unnamed protein product [Digitaria exilis]
MDVRSNYPLSAQPGTRGSIPPREAWVASSSAPSNGELEARLGGYTRGCASAPPRILGTHEDMKASKASANSSLRRIKPHPCEGSGATVGYLQKGYPNLGPKLLGIKARNDIDLAQQPSKGPPSRLGGLDPHPRAGSFRLVRGLANSSLRSKLDAQPTAVHQSRHDAVKKQGSLLHAITYSRRGHRAMLHARPNPASSTVPTTPLTLPPAGHAATLEGNLEGDHGTPCARHHPRRRELSREGRTIRQPLPCRQRSWKARFPLTHMHLPTNTCTRTLLPLVYKRGREAHEKERNEKSTKTRREHNLGLRSLSPSPTLLVNPYYKQHVTRCIAPLLDVRPRGRNQDKTSSLTLAIGKNEWLAPQSLVGAGATKTGTDTLCIRLADTACSGVCTQVMDAHGWIPEIL